MNLPHFFFILFFISGLITACSERNPVDKLITGMKPCCTITPETEEKEECEQIVDSHADCFESIINKGFDTEEFNKKAFEECYLNSINSIEHKIQSEKKKDALKEVVTAFGLNAEAVPASCAAKSKNPDVQFICVIRLEKQKVCSQ